MAENEYNNDSIESCNDEIEAIRKKPASIGIEDHNHLFTEVLANSIDEAREGYGKLIEITKHKDLSITVKDFGRGIPLGKNSKGEYVYSKVLCKLWSGGKMNNTSQNGGYLYSLGTNGCGLKACNFTSDIFQCTSFRDNKKYFIEYQKGRQNTKLQEEKCNYDSTGTTITWKPSKEVFRTGNDTDIEFMKTMLKQQAIINGGLKFIFKNEINNITQEFYYENGAIDFIKEYGEDGNLSDIIYWSTETEGKDKVKKDDKLEEEENNKLYKIKCNLAFTFNNNKQLMEFYHNGSYLKNGGTPEDFIKNGFVYAIDKYLKDNNLYQKSDKKIAFDDIKDSLIIISDTYSTISLYTDQTKKQIDSELMKSYMTEYIKQQLEIYFTENPLETKRIMNQCLINMRANKQAEQSKLNIKKKLQSKSNFTDNIDTFYDCISNDKNIKELYLCEGSSAEGSIVTGRNSQFQACFHVGGKMLSLLKAKYSTIFKNTVVKNLYKILKCGIEIKTKENKDIGFFNEKLLDFSKIILATDQDTDAYQIRCLILACIYRLSKTLIEKGYVYIAESPLFEIETENKKIYYAYTEQEKDDIIENLKKKHIKYNKPERNKGLGQVEASTIAKTMMNPNTRKITQVTVRDAEKMSKEFELWLGDNIEPRKEEITNNFDYQEHFDDEKKKDITKVLRENYLPYSIEVVKERSIIAIDGFKPAHRKLLWTLHEKNLYDTRTKSANIVGNNMSYNVHGDGSIYDTLVRMAQKDTLLYPYVNGKGNFGQHTSKLLQAAHMRYTEAGAANINKEFFQDINKNTIDFMPNFDGEKKEPILLNTTFPNVLVNNNEGIAVGMASKTPSYNLNEVCNFTIAYIKNKNIKVSDYLLSPDFATGGYIIKNSDIENIYNTGKGTFILRAKYKINKENIIIYEIPYSTSREGIIKSIKDLCKAGKLNEIIDIKDTTELSGMSITIKIKKNTNIKLLITKLYRMTPLEDKYSCNMNIICLDKIPRVLSMKQIIDEWLKFRRQCIIRSIKYDIDDKNSKLHLYKGLEKILLNIDKVISIIRNSISDDLIINNLINEFNIDKNQAENIANMKLRQINKQYIVKKINLINSLEEEIFKLNEILSNKSAIDNIIIKDLERIKKTYGKPRQTEIIMPEEIQQVSDDQLIEEYSTYCTLSEQGYFHKLLKKSDNIKSKDNDKIIKETYSNNKSTLLLFSNKSNCYKLYEYELQDDKPSNFGQYLSTLLQLEDDEKIINMVSVDDNYKGNLIEIFENGKIANIELTAFKTETKRSKLKNSLCLKNRKLLNMFIINKDVDIILQSSLNKVLITNTSYINSKASKSANGNQIMKSKKDSKVIFAEQLQNINTELIQDIEYYKNKNGTGIGVYLKEGDNIKLL